ncbi:MAG: flagellar motor switch protein FliG [Treponema sp.]|jgi:flagellar motor switch protein FliG|nr:flagellar motor switch protein FliG [Treponema sp.]
MGNILRRGIESYRQTINQEKNRPESSEKLIKTASPLAAVPLAEPTAVQTAAPESKYRRVAKFLILIGTERAAEILSQLDPEQVEKISKEIALVRTIKPNEGNEILSEFHSLFSGPYRFSGSTHGGIETARRILYAARGAEKGEALLNKAVPESRDNLFGFLEEFSAEQLVMLLKSETPQTTALILSRLSPKLSAGALNKFLPKYKAGVLRRIAHQQEISPEVLEQVTAALKEKVRNISGGAKDLEIDGMQTLTSILKQGDYAFGGRLINELEQSDPDIGKELKEKLYTLDDVVNAVDRPLQEKLETMSERDIAVLLKGRKTEFCEKLLSNVSEGRRKLINEESEILGAVLKRDCDDAAGEFLAWFRKARESRKIILYSDEDVYL